MDLHDLADVLSADGPFVTVHVASESAVEQSADAYDRAWKSALQELRAQGVGDDVLAAVSDARGSHDEGASRFVVASVPDATVRLATSLGSAPRRRVLDVAALPHLMPLVDDLASQVPHVVVLADRTGADISAWYDSEHEAVEATVRGHAPDIRKVQVGGWSQLRYQQRAEEGWEANAREIASGVADLAEQVHAESVLAAGDAREVALVRDALPTHLQDRVVVVEGGRGGDGSEDLVRGRIADALALHRAQATLDLLESYAQERGQGKRAADGVEDVVAALRKAQVQTLLVTTEAVVASTLFFGPQPTQLATREQDLRDLGVTDVQEGPMVDVLLRAALGTAADVQLVPHELPTAPAGGVGAVLRYADSLGTSAEAQQDEVQQ